MERGGGLSVSTPSLLSTRMYTTILNIKFSGEAYRLPFHLGEGSSCKRHPLRHESTPSSWTWPSPARRTAGWGRPPWGSAPSPSRNHWCSGHKQSTHTLQRGAPLQQRVEREFEAVEPEKQWTCVCACVCECLCVYCKAKNPISWHRSSHIKIILHTVSEY